MTRCVAVSAAAAAAGLLGFAAPAFSATLGFGGAELGQSLPAWRALAPPAGVSPAAKPACSDDAQVAGARHDALTPTAAQSGFVVCGYVTIDGDYVFTQAMPFDERVRKADVRYLFRQGRLAEIQVLASIDTYDDVMADLKRRYGPPSQTQWDSVRYDNFTLDRVRQTWSTAAGEIELTDPASDPARLSLDISGAPGAASTKTAAAASGEPG